MNAAAGLLAPLLGTALLLRALHGMHVSVRRRDWNALAEWSIVVVAVAVAVQMVVATRTG